MAQRQLVLKNAMAKVLHGEGVGAVLARGASQSLVVQVTGTGLAFIAQVVLARILGVQHFGDYIYVLTWINILVLVGKLGYDTATLRYVPKYQVEQEWGLLKGFLIRSQHWVLMASFLVAMGVVTLSWINQSRLGTTFATVFYVGAFLIPASSLLQLYGARLRTQKKIIAAQAPLQILRPILLMIMVGVTFILLQRPMTGYQAMAMNLFAVLIALGTSLWMYRRHRFPEIHQEVKPTYRNKEWMSVAFPLLLISGMQMVNQQLDIVMLGILRSTEEAGIYSSAHRIATLVLFGLNAVNMMAAPMISELYSSGRMKELQRMVTLASWGIFAVTGLGSLVLILLGQWVLSFFGQAFVVAYIPLLILLFGNVVNALCGSVGLILNMTGNQKISGRIVASAVVMNVLLNLWFVPLWGMVGAAAATAITMIYWNVFMSVVVMHKLKINPTIIQGRRRKYEET